MKKITLMMAMLLLSALSFAQVDLYNGLIAYYPFNGNINDASGNGYNARMENDNGDTLSIIGYSIDRFGNANSAGDFQYDRQMVAMPTITSGSTATVAFWFKTLNQYSVPFKVFEYGLSASQYRTDIIYAINTTLNSIEVTLTDRDDVGVGCYEDAVVSSNTSSTYLNNAWHMVLIEKNGASLSCYIDSTLIGTTTHGDTCNAANNMNFLIMVFGGAGTNPSNSFDGDADDIMIYNRLLNAAEKDSLYNLSTSLSPILATVSTPSAIDVKVFPNPSTSTAQLTFPTTDAYQVQITDLTGRHVFQKQVANSQSLEIQTATWPAGIYMVQVCNERGGMTVQKLVKE